MRTPFDADAEPPEADDDLDCGYPTRVATDDSLEVEPLFLGIQALGLSRVWKSQDELQAAVERAFPEGRPPPPTDAAGQARECLARAGRAGSDEAAAAYVDEAFDLDPRNPDVLRLRASRGASLLTQIPLVEDAIAEALARAGGPAAVAEHLGAAWAVPPLRPYLRARARKVELLIELGRDAEAVLEGEVLLDLDATDALVIRYRLVGSYLVLADPAAYRRLRMRFPEDESFFFVWGDVLAALLSDDEDAASLALGAALDDESGIEEMLLAPWEAVSDMLDRCVAGGESECSFVVDTLFPAWCAAPSALAWLRTEARLGTGRPGKVRKLLATLRPERDDGPEPRWLEWALRGEREAPEGLLRAIRTDGERGVAWLCALLRRADLGDERALGEGFGPATAAVLLGELVAPSSLPAMLEVLDGADTHSEVFIHLLPAFRRFGSLALEPLLHLLDKDRYQDEEGVVRREGVLVALVALGIPDDRVFAAAAECLRLKPEGGPLQFAELRMPQALPLLSAWLDAQQVGLADDLTAYADRFGRVVVTIAELGGTLTAAQEQKRVRLAAILAGEGELRPDHDDAEFDAWADDPNGEVAKAAEAALESLFGSPRPKRKPKPRPAAAPPAPPLRTISVGRNARCPCGSGKKYKACCWDKDHGGP